MADSARQTLADLCADRGESLAGLSRLVGRNDAYIQQYLKKGTPRRLPERERRLLARYFGVSEAVLGGPADGDGGGPAEAGAMIAMPRTRARVSAGPGVEPVEMGARAVIAFDRTYLRAMSATPAERLTMVRVEGDSMFPTFRPGDELLVDHDDGAARLRDGVYVLRANELLVVKRLAINPAGRRITVQSDNPDYPDWPDRDPHDIHVIGRVIWAGRRVG